MPQAKAEITLTVDGITKTFTAAGDTGGDPCQLARSILFAASQDAGNWTHELAGAARKAGVR